MECKMMIEKIKVDPMHSVVEAVFFFFDDRNEKKCILITSKDPGSEDPALVSPQRGGVYLRLRMD